jgi:low temperature requirement protein LtrA
VFVFTITQVAEVVVRHPDGRGIALAMTELTVLSWMFGGYAWLTNAAGAVTSSCRSVLIAGMAGFFICALAVPHAFDEDGVAFGAAYFFVNVIHLTGLMLGETPKRVVWRLAAFNLVSASLVFAAGFVTGTLDWWLWLGAIAVQVSTPFLGRPERGFDLHPKHFAERHGLMILIVLGESLVSVGLAVSATAPHINPALLFGALSGLAAAAAMWWAYFAGEDERAARAHERAGQRQRANQGLLGFGLAHLIMMFGIIAVAAATKLSLNHLLSPMPMFSAALMASGCALYLLGGAMFRWALGYASPAWRVMGGLASVIVLPAGLYASPAAALAMIAVVTSATLAV